MLVCETEKINATLGCVNGIKTLVNFLESKNRQGSQVLDGRVVSFKSFLGRRFLYYCGCERAEKACMINLVFQYVNKRSSIVCCFPRGSKYLHFGELFLSLDINLF